MGEKTAIATFVVALVFAAGIATGVHLFVPLCDPNSTRLTCTLEWLSGLASPVAAVSAAAAAIFAWRNVLQTRDGAKTSRRAIISAENSPRIERLLKFERCLRDFRQVVVGLDPTPTAQMVNSASVARVYASREFDILETRRIVTLMDVVQQMQVAVSMHIFSLAQGGALTQGNSSERIAIEAIESVIDLVDAIAAAMENGRAVSELRSADAQQIRNFARSTN